MARGRKAGGAKRGPKPKMTKEDGEALAKALRRLTKLVRAIHAEVVPGSTEGAPEPEEVLVVASVAAEALPVEAEVTVVPVAQAVAAPATTGVTPDGTALRI